MPAPVTTTRRFCPDGLCSGNSTIQINYNAALIRADPSGKTASVTVQRFGLMRKNLAVHDGFQSAETFVSRSESAR